MPDDHNTCGHSEEEHKNMANEIQQRISQGDITALIPTISNNNLNLLLQAAAAEMFVRSVDWDAARANWEQLDHLVRSTLFVDKAEDSAFPVEYSMLKKANSQYRKLIELDKMAAEGEEGLKDLFEEHGVEEAKRPHKRDDDFPGFYL
jgi:hypothetical protein